MADFKTHVTVAAALSTPLAASAFIAGFASMNDAIFYALAGTLGGLMPDIDSDESIAIRLVFRLLGALIAGLTIAFSLEQLPHWQVLGLAVASYLVIRFPIQWVFEQLTIHRGTLHSLLANVMFALLTVAITYHVFELSPKTAWGIGVFVFFGAMIHLLLDEIYSIDLSGMRIKRSFGTALKLTDWSQPLASMVLVVLCVAGFVFSPDASAWQATLTWLPQPAMVSEWLAKEWTHLQSSWG